MSDLLPESLREWLDATLGAGWQLIDGKRGFVQADLWTLEAGGARFVLKAHRSAAAFARELHAYEHFAPHLGASVPTLVAACHPQLPRLVFSWPSGPTLWHRTLGHSPSWCRDADSPGRSGKARAALLLSHVGGVALDESSDELRRAPSIFEHAGRFWAALGEVPVRDDDAMGLEQAVVKRFEGWLERAHGNVPAALLAQVSREVNPACFEHVSRSACHRDFAPWNWLYDEARDELVVIDFGQARLDDPLVDLVKLTTGIMPEGSRARRAFHRGAGRELTTREQRRLRQLELLHGLATTVWGQTHADAALRARGLEILQRLVGQRA